jgi:hypothetical protein
LTIVLSIARDEYCCYSSEYTHRLVEEINDMLVERGLIAMNDLIRQFDLPTEYLQSIVNNRILGSSLNTIRFDSGTLYTDTYVRLQQNTIIGYLQAALLPVRIHDILKQSRINDNLVQSIPTDVVD